MIRVFVRKAGAPLVALSLLLLAFLAIAPQPALSSALSEAPLQDYEVYLPFITRAEEPPPGLVNGDFEAGPVGWVEYSQQAWPLIMTADDAELPAHSGTWLVWLGGDENEVASIEQTFWVPNSSTTLSYYVWVDSGDSCDQEYDIWRLTVNGTQLDGFTLCEGVETNGWVRREVNISPYAGQQVSLMFYVSTDDSFTSSLFVDDVSVSGNTLAPASEVPFLPVLGLPERK